MTTFGKSEGTPGEHSPNPTSPEQATIEFLKSLAKEPTSENFANAQALLDEKLEATQTDINAFRFIVSYLNEKSLDAAIRSIERREHSSHLETPYDYTIEYEVTDLPEYDSMNKKIARFVLRKAPPQPKKRVETITQSVLDDFSPLRVKLPVNWNDIVTKYVALPDHHVMQLPYHPSPDKPVDDWETLKQAKVEFARRVQAQVRGGNTDLEWWGYQPAIDEQAKIVKELNRKMGLKYENGFLVQ